VGLYFHANIWAGFDIILDSISEMDANGTCLKLDIEARFLSATISPIYLHPLMTWAELAHSP